MANANQLPTGLTPIDQQQQQLPPGLTPITGQSAPAEQQQADTFLQVGSDLIKSVREDISKRVDAEKQTIVDYITAPPIWEGGMGKVEAAGQILGQGAGGVLDITGDLATAVIRGGSILIPDFIEKPVVDTFKRGINYLSDTTVGEMAKDALKKGVKGWGEFKQGNPRAAKDIESVLNMGILFAPIKAKAEAPPITFMEKAASGIEKAAIKQQEKSKLAFIQDLILPKQTAAQKIEQVQRTVPGGILSPNKVIPTAREQQATKVLMDLDVSPKYSLQKNYYNISQANNQMANRLKILVGASKAKVPHQSSKAYIDNAVNDLVKTNPVIVGNAETTANRVAQKAKELIDANDATPGGILKARKELDAWIKAQKGDKIFDPASESALSVSVRKIRQSMNELVDANVKSTKVHDELRKQSLLYDAMENIAPKTAEQASTAVGRLWQNVARATHLKYEANRELAVLMGLTAFGAAGYMFPYMMGGVVLGGVGRAAYKGTMSPAMKKGIVKLIRASNKAIQNTRNSKMRRQLRADRGAAIELLKHVRVEMENSNGEEQ